MKKMNKQSYKPFGEQMKSDNIEQMLQLSKKFDIKHLHYEILTTDFLNIVN